VDWIPRCIASPVAGYIRDGGRGLLNIYTPITHSLCTSLLMHPFIHPSIHCSTRLLTTLLNYCACSMCARVSQVRACEPVPPERKKRRKKDSKLLAPPFPFLYPRHRDPDPDPDPEPIGKTKRLKRRDIQRRGRKVPSRLVSRRLGSRLCHDYDHVLVTIPID
jgi:hypothetical protein